MLVKDIHLLLNSLSRPNEVLLVSLLLFLLDFLQSLLLNSLIFILLLFKVNFDCWIKTFLDATAMSFIFTLDKCLNIPMLLLLHNVENLLALILHADFVLIRDLDVTLNTVDELLDKWVGPLMVLVASTHGHHGFGELSFFGLIRVVDSALVYLVFLLLVEAWALLGLAAGAHQRGEDFLPRGED